MLFFFLVSFLLLPHNAHAQDKTYDFIIKDALVFDGESMEPIKQDIAITGNRIVQLGQLAREEGREVVEAEGLVAAPGFIDLHTHSDFNPFVYPDLGNKVLQGVTTEVAGNCGMSAAPVTGAHKEHIAEVWRREGVQIPSKLSWESFQEYGEEIELKGLDTNLASLVGHGNLRSAQIAMNPRDPTPDEVEEMRKLLHEALDEGAFGVSFGLAYLPGTFSKKEELVEICREAGLKKRPCVFHMRSESKQLIEAVQEAIEIAREADAPLHISHLKASGRSNWPKIHEVFNLIEKAQSEGLAVTADAYPYTAGVAELGVILPNAIYQDPGRVARFKDLAKRGKLLRELRKHYEASPVSWDAIKIATVTQLKSFPLQGKSIQQIAGTWEKTPVEVLVELLAQEEFQVSAFYFSQSEAVMEEVLSKPYVAIGSDSIADGSASPHPRSYGTFPRILARCPKDAVTRDPCWGRSIHQMTVLPARILGLKDRGKIYPGFSADLVLFDPATVQDKADYANPKAQPVGIQWVFVNGKPAVRNGKYKPVHSGLFLTSQK